MEYLLLLALIFFIKSSLTIIDYFVVMFEEMSSHIKFEQQQQQIALNEDQIDLVSDFTIKQFWFDALRYLVTRNRNFSIFLITGSFLYCFL